MYWVKLAGRAPVATVTCGHRVAQVSFRVPLFPLKGFTTHCIAQLHRHVDVIVVEEDFPLDDERKVEIYSGLLDGDIDISQDEESFVIWLIAQGFQPKGRYHIRAHDAFEIQVSSSDMGTEQETESDGKINKPDESIIDGKSPEEPSKEQEQEKITTQRKKKGARRGRTNKRKHK